MKKKYVIDNLEEFADKVVHLIADESADVISLIKNAKESYEKPLESWLQSWIYSYTRNRGEEVEQAMRGIKSSSQVYQRIVAIEELITKGEWKEGSFNTFLLKEVIKSIPGYESNGKELTQANLIRLKDLIISAIELYKHHHRVAERDKQSREAELKGVNFSVNSTLEQVVLFSNLEQAKAAQETKDSSKKCFSMHMEKNKLKLYWVDFLGKVYSLTPSSNLLRNPNKLFGADTSNAIKAECDVLHRVFLEKVNVKINPQETNPELIEKRVCSTFILRGQPNEYRLYWLSSLAKEMPISLDDYPQLNTWLNENDTPDEGVLRTHLLHINLSRSLGMEAFKSRLQDCLGGRFGFATATKDNPEVGKINLEAFSMIAKLFAETGERNAPPSQNHSL